MTSLNRALPRAMRLLCATSLATALCPATAQTSGQPSFAEPALSPDGRQIAFASGGDIWEVPASGGVAHLLVTDAATESRPLYSPDGRKLAFVSTRSGNANIYLLDLASGAVTRLTWDEGGDELDAWSADGKWLYFASTIDDVGREPDIFRVAVTGGTPMPVSQEVYLAEFHGSPSPDGTTLALMARGLSDGQWWRNGHSHIDETELWTKRIGEPGGYTLLLADSAKHAWPMWSPDGRQLWFMSDKSGAENLWRMPAAGGTAEQVTRFADGRVLFPSLAANGSAIVFERDFGIWRFDVATGQAAAVPITLRGAPAGEGVKHVDLKQFERLALSPDGQKIAVIGHGELFAGSAKDGGPAQRLTTSAGAEREIAWSPDSMRVLYVTERGLDHKLAEYDFASGAERLLDIAGVASAIAYAPDGKSAAYVLGTNELHIVTLPRAGQAPGDRIVFTGAIATDEGGPRPVWSPDGKYIAFPVTDRRSFTNVHVVPAAGGEARPISFLANGQIGGIAWSPDGSYILFDSAQRTENARIVRVDLLPHVPKYREDAFRDLFDQSKTPGTPKADGGAKPKPDAPAAAKPATPKAVTIEFDGLRERATLLPLGVDATNPVISADGKTLIFQGNERGQANFYQFDLDELADDPAAKQITSTGRPKGDFALSPDGKTLFYLEAGTLLSTPLDSPRPKPVALAAELDVDFATEKQIVFDEAWSTLNRNFYDPKFHGRDWTGLRTKFQPLVTGARTGDELRRVISQMIGELDASHSGIGRPRGGPGAPPRDQIGQLGLGFDRTAYEAGQGLVIRTILPLGPAAVSGKIKLGDRLTSVNGQPIAASTNLDAMLLDQTGKRVTLGIAGAGGERQVVVQPVSAQTTAGLRYRAWVADRRAYVDKASNGKLGYVHLPDMSAASLDQLYIDLDAQNQSKQGVVIDVRNNNGGFINGFALDVFARRNYLTFTPRNLFPIPSRQALGQRALGLPTVLVTNESSLSDAEDFSEGYRALGLGKIVGVPTAGWIIYTGGERLIDGSTVRLPTIRVQGIKGDDMEGHPRPVDITVARPLGESVTGRDAQLDAAIAALIGAQPTQ